MVNICIVHYNTPLLTEYLIKSINKFTPNSKIYIFDNSDKEPFTYRQKNIVYFDNTHGNIIDFDKWLKQFPNRSGSCYSPKHCISIQKCIELIKDSFILLDSDVLLKRDISDLYDNNYAFIGEESKETIVGKYTVCKRIFPFICFINPKLLKKYNVSYFNEHMQDINVFSDNKIYDTGSSLYNNKNILPHKLIDKSSYIVHFGGGSYDDNVYLAQKHNSNKKESIYNFLETNKLLWCKTYRFFKNELLEKARSLGIYLNLDNPSSIQDKINWLKLFDTTGAKTKCSDKIKLHEFCKETLGKDICVPIIKIYNNSSEIDWNELPNQFVIKCNHGSGMNIIVSDKSKLNKSDAIAKLNKWMKTDFAFQNGFELQYHGIERKIFIEEYKSDDSQKNSLYDYKIWCFNGEPKFYTINDGQGHGDILYYTMSGEEMNPYMVSNKNTYKKPNGFNQMVKYAKKLSSNFTFVRVDFYEINNEIYLGELTFTPGSGFFKYRDTKYNKIFGDLLDISKLLPKNVIYTCITKNYDDLIEPKIYIDDFDLVCFTDNDSLSSKSWIIKNIPLLNNYSPVKQQRYIKTHPHEFFKNYETSIWIDANIELLDNPKDIIDSISSNIAIPMHPNRKCIYKEAEACKKAKKDKPEIIDKQIEKYKKEKFPENFGLVQSNIVIRHHNSDDCIFLMNSWWEQIANESHRDQLSFNYVIWKTGLSFEYLDKALCNSKYFYWRKEHGRKNINYSNFGGTYDIIGCKPIKNVEPVPKIKEPTPKIDKVIQIPTPIKRIFY